MRLQDYLLVYWNFNFTFTVYYCVEMSATISIIKHLLAFFKALKRQLLHKLQLLLFTHHLVVVLLTKLPKEIRLFF